MGKNAVLEFNKIQMLEMEKHKWIESDKSGFDIGERAYLDWIKKHARIFRNEWVEKKLS